MKYENTKLEWCRDELKMLLRRLIDGNYHKTAEVVFDHVAHTGVETDMNPALKTKPTLDDFLKSE
jgi:hypothetical protein